MMTDVITDVGNAVCQQYLKSISATAQFTVPGLVTIYLFSQPVC